MTSSLVGSEMCIRDSSSSRRPQADRHAQALLGHPSAAQGPVGEARLLLCLLYTSDAADDM
eukprot:12804622-Prorocentrum_lima.AAC.1